MPSIPVQWLLFVATIACVLTGCTDEDWQIELRTYERGSPEDRLFVDAAGRVGAPPIRPAEPARPCAGVTLGRGDISALHARLRAIPDAIPLDSELQLTRARGMHHVVVRTPDGYRGFAVASRPSVAEKAVTPAWLSALVGAMLEARRRYGDCRDAS